MRVYPGRMREHFGALGKGFELFQTPVLNKQKYSSSTFCHCVKLQRLWCGSSTILMSLNNIMIKGIHPFSYERNLQSGFIARICAST